MLLLYTWKYCIYKFNVMSQIYVIVHMCFLCSLSLEAINAF